VLFTAYTHIRFNMSLRRLDTEINVYYKTIYRRIEHFLRVLDAPRLQLKSSIEIDEVHVNICESHTSLARQ